MARAEGGLVLSGVGYAEGCPLFNRLGGLGSVVSSPSRVWGRDPAKNGFWHFLKATEHSFFLHYMTKSVGDNLHYRPPYSKFWGGGTCPSVPP